MITLMRRYRRTLQIGLLLVVAAFVASLFIFGSSGFVGDGSVDAVATVNGERIPVERYQRRYQEYVNAYAQLLRERFSQEMIERLGLQQQVVEDLVREALIVQRAKAEGLAATDAELVARVHAIPAFHEGGRFTMRRYEDVLQRAGITTAAFEEDMRRRITREKVAAAVRAGVKVSDAEVEQAFVHKHEAVRAVWALVELDPLVEAASASDEELRAYYDEHAAELRLPERRRIQYVTLAPKDFERPVPQAEVERYYREHAAEFETPRAVRARHILVRVPETGGSQAEDAAKAKVAEAIRRAKAGEDFAKLARGLSEDPATAPRGGDLGFVRPGELVPQFEAALLALGKGEISPEPVRTPFGYHAIRVEEVREGGKQPLGEVARELRERLQKDAADRAAKARADEVRATLLGAADFVAEAKKLGLEPVTTTVARREQSVPSFVPPDAFEETAFQLTLGGVSLPLQTPAGWVVVKAVEALPAAVPPLEEIRDKVAAAVKRRKADTTAGERAREVAEAGRAGDLTAAARKAGAKVGEPARFSRAKPADAVPADAMVAALQAPAGAVTDPIKTAQGYYVLKVLERIPPDMSRLADERRPLAEELRTRKRGQVWQAWIAGARAQAKIEVSSRLPGRRS